MNGRHVRFVLSSTKDTAHYRPRNHPCERFDERSV